MDFSKAFDSVNHSKLSAKLKQLPSILTSLTGTIASWLLSNREFSIIVTSVPGRSLTREPPKIKWCLLLVINVIRLLTLWDNSWHGPERTTCLAIRKKCKELIFRSKGNNSQYNPVFDISQCSSLVLLGVTIKSDCKFRAHVNLKLIKANKCLHVLKTLRKEQF